MQNLFSRYINYLEAERNVSPNTVRMKAELLSDLEGVDRTLKLMTLSFYPHATKHDLRLLLAVISLFFVVFNVFWRPAQIKRLLLAIALIGGVIAAIVIAQNTLGNGKIYWYISSSHTKGYSGPFVNTQISSDDDAFEVLF